MQGRVFAYLASGRISLPADVDKRVADYKSWADEALKWDECVDTATPSAGLLLDTMAEDIGALPSTWWFLRHPFSALTMFFGPWNQAGVVAGGRPLRTPAGCLTPQRWTASGSAEPQG